jgi:hypothetical protein
MIALIALALITTDPAQLLGGPQDVRPEPRPGAVVHAYEEQAYRAEGAYERYRHERGQMLRVGPANPALPDRRLQAGDPVSLDDGFFRGPLVGGVGGEPPRIIIVRRNTVTSYHRR